MTEYRYYRDYTTNIITHYPSTAYPNHRGQPPEHILVTRIDIRTLSYTFTTSSTYHLGGVSIIIPDDIITARTIIDNDRCMLVYRIYVIATDGVEGPSMSPSMSLHVHRRHLLSACVEGGRLRVYYVRVRDAGRGGPSPRDSRRSLLAILQ